MAGNEHVPSPPRSGEKVAAGRMRGLTMQERHMLKIQPIFAPSPNAVKDFCSRIRENSDICLRSCKTDCGGRGESDKILGSSFLNA